MAAQGDAGGKAETMREIPVLFNGAMVRAILDDRKTQTRRIVKPQPWQHPDTGVWWIGEDTKVEDLLADRTGVCKYLPGDRLWVRETWAMLRGATELVTFEGQIPERRPKSDSLILGMVPAPFYRADGERPDVASGNGLGKAWKWRPSIHMPRWAARLFLDVVDVRIERLQDISEEDARAEGMDWTRPQYLQPKDDNDQEDPRQVGYPSASDSFARDNFRRLWTNIYGAESWAANPWVWVTEFKRVKRALETKP